MLSRTVTCENYNGEMITKKLYFNLTAAELVTMDAQYNGGYENFLNDAINNRDTKAIMDAFRALIRASYGVRTPDGNRFAKSPEICDEFEQSPMYDEIFMEMFLDPDKFRDFVHGILPNTDKYEKFAKKREEDKAEALDGTVK